MIERVEKIKALVEREKWGQAEDHLNKVDKRLQAILEHGKTLLQLKYYEVFLSKLILMRQKKK